MQWQTWSKRQRDAAIDATARINFFHGPVRAGKTTAQRAAWLNFLGNSPHHNLLVSGKTKDTIKRNVLDDMFRMMDAMKIKYRYNSASGTITTVGKTMHIVGANDEGATDRIHGLTIGGWLGDEMTLHPESFVKMALSRMSMAGARAFWTTNPDSPFHYLKKEYLDNQQLIEAGIVKPVGFKLEDNLSLDEEYLQALKLLYTGLWKKRYIDGLWVQAAGAIWDSFDPDIHVIDFLPLTFDAISVGVDYGTASVTAFIAAGRNNGKWYVFREYYFDARETYKQKTNGEIADDFEHFIDGINPLASGKRYPDRRGEITPDTIEIDPSATGLRVELRQRGFWQIRNADNDVLEGIRNVGNAFANEDLYVYSACQNMQEEIVGYVWDEEKQQLGIDEPVKEHDHANDSLRYLLKRHYGRPQLTVVGKPAGA